MSTAELSGNASRVDRLRQVSTAEPELVASDEAPSAPAMDTPILQDGHELTLDTIAQRYPLLRNAL